MGQRFLRVTAIAASKRLGAPRRMDRNAGLHRPVLARGAGCGGAPEFYFGPESNWRSRAMKWIMTLALAVLIGGADALAGAGRQPAHTPAPTGDEFRTAVFAGGCFWCVEEAFDTVAGVVETTSGYTGGKVPAPSYEPVSAGGTGHAHEVQVRSDPRTDERRAGNECGRTCYFGWARYH